MIDDLEQEINALTAKINQDTEARQKRIDALVENYNKIDNAFQNNFSKDDALMYLAHEQVIQKNETDIAKSEAITETILNQALENEEYNEDEEEYNEDEEEYNEDEEEYNEDEEEDEKFKENEK